VGRFPDLRRRNCSRSEVIDGDPFLKERSRGTAALCQRGHPPLSDSAVLPVPGAGLNAGNTHGIARAVSPPWGKGWREGGAGRVQENRSVRSRSGRSRITVCLFSKIFRQFWFSSGTFLELSDFEQKKSGRKTFAPKIFRIFNVRPKNFPVFQISRPKKVRVLWHPGPDNRQRFTTVLPVSCQTDNLFSNFRANFFFFFQLSIQKFLQFSTFEPKKSGRTNFQTKNFWPEKISDRTGRTRSAGSDPAIRKVSVVKPATTGSFSSFRGDLLEIFWRKSSYKRKKFRHELAPLMKNTFFDHVWIRSSVPANVKKSGNPRDLFLKKSGTFDQLFFGKSGNAHQCF
jgi:hypothetical protein